MQILTKIIQIMTLKASLNRLSKSLQLMLIIVLLGVSSFVDAQQADRKITGVVISETKEPMIGVSVYIPGTTNGTTTDINGKYSITLPANKTELVFSFVGYNSQTIKVGQNTTINVSLDPLVHALGDVVVIGYGVQKKKDLTGSVAVIGAKDFNTGVVSSPEQLINGKVAGVQITQSGGSPTSGSTIRIRGGASLNASNDPLIVLDGVPLEIGGISGNTGNFLSLINPNDIENMTILKDASSTAIYGSRASNGVIIITTKKGTGDKIKVSFSTTNSLQVKTKTAEMLSTDEFINLVNSNGSAAQKALLGTERTNWNDKVYQTAFGTDNNVSISGRIAKNIPIRTSVGYYNQDGILKTDNSERYTGNISVSPSLLSDHLKLNFNVKGTLNNNTFANQSAIWNAAAINPTIPVYSGSTAFGGYTEAVDKTGNTVNGAIANPVGLLNLYNSTSKVYRVLGNFDLDYKFHMLPELKFHTTLGYDYAKGKGSIFVPDYAYSNYSTKGLDYEYGPQEKTNKLLTSYFNYNKEFANIKSTVDATLGYDYQFWKDNTVAYTVTNTEGTVNSTVAASDQRHVLLSYYFRLNYSYDSKYMATVTVRRDGTSRFSEDNRWGTFPSVALGWKISDESFLKDSQWLSNLKLRLSYGVTGQQDGIGNYSYLPIYTYGQAGAQYLFGNEYYYTYRPEAYDANRKWESTTAYNAGFDFGFLKNRINGSVDYYTRKTKDLLANVPIPAGANFNKTMVTNVGNVDSKGVEATLNVIPVSTEDLTWNISLNWTWQKMKVTNLSLVKGSSTNTPVGQQVDGTYFQVLSEGYAPYMFYVYHQLYDSKGKPIEGAYADINGDGQINTSDLYRFHSPAPDFIYGLSTSLRYKKWNLGMSFRANVGNYAYNGTAMNMGAWETMSYNSYQLNNLSKSYLSTGFQKRQYLSDYYVENASFLKMDNLSLGYNFGQVTRWMRLNATAMVQNVFTITNYSGVDPEIPNGIDMTFYPRPRVYSLGLSFEF